jgi:hypothetical protein
MAADRGMSLERSGQRNDRFLSASLAEACVLLGRFDEARPLLKLSTTSGVDLQPVAGAIRGHLAALGEDPTLLDDVLLPPGAA